MGDVETLHLMISEASLSLRHQLWLSWLPRTFTVGHRALSVSITHMADITSWHEPNSGCSHLHLCWSMHGQKSISVKKSHAQYNRENNTPIPQSIDIPIQLITHSYQGTMTLICFCLLLISLTKMEKLRPLTWQKFEEDEKKMSYLWSIIQLSNISWSALRCQISI